MTPASEADFQPLAGEGAPRASVVRKLIAPPSQERLAPASARDLSPLSASSLRPSVPLSLVSSSSSTGFILFLLVNATLFIRPSEISPSLEGLPIYNVV